MNRDLRWAPRIFPWPPGHLLRLGAVTLLLALPSRAVAQVVRGRVVESGSARGIGGGLIQLLDSLSTPIASATTSETGTFSLGPVAAGRYRLRALRIGFRPWLSQPLTLAAGQVRDTVLQVPAEAIVLDEIVVQATSSCARSPSSDERMALLWDAARATLGLAGAGGAPLEFQNNITHRRRNPSNRVVEETWGTAIGSGDWPVTSQPAESLAALGFVQPTDSVRGPIYYGPDVAVFFSDVFLQTHCFRLVQAPKLDPTLLGLGFEPVKGRTVPDIEGVLWLDRHGGLTRLEYRYTSLWGWVPHGGAGGELQFLRLPGGRPVVSGWLIRAPMAAVGPYALGEMVRDEKARAFFGNGRVSLGGFREEIGRVDEVRTPQGRVLWRRGEGPATPGGPAVPSRRAS